MNKKGEVGVGLISGLVGLFVVGLMIVIFGQVLTDYIVPISEERIDSQTGIPYFNSSQADGLKENNANYMALFNTLPWVIIVAVVLYFVIISIRARKEEVQ